MSTKLNVLIIGSGGRENAITAACARSERCGQLFAAPGSPGIARYAQIADVDSNDSEAIASFCAAHKVRLVIIGPEAPLAAGLASTLRAHGIPVFGPGKEGARLEASKEYAKNFMAHHHIPTAGYTVCHTVDEVRDALGKYQPPYIIKASGLAAGKGVFIEPTTDAAVADAESLIVAKKLGTAGETIVVEEALAGRELSLMVVTDTHTWRLLSTSQDHKRLRDGDAGPNTGGMGAYAPARWVTPTIMNRALREVVRPTIDALASEKIDYRGVLYIGLMIAPDGTPKVLEYNVRLGDPETEVLLPLFKGDFIDMCDCCAHGHLGSYTWHVPDGKALCVILASAGYPTSKSEPAEITGISDAESDPAVTVFHCGTAIRDGKLTATGGRVLCVTATGETLEVARDRAYAAAGKISFNGMQYRRDIGHQAFEES